MSIDFEQYQERRIKELETEIAYMENEAVHQAKPIAVKDVIEMARVAGIFDAYYLQSLAGLRAALLRFHAGCVLNADKQHHSNIN